MGPAKPIATDELISTIGRDEPFELVEPVEHDMQLCPFVAGHDHHLKIIFRHQLSMVPLNV